MKSFKYLWEDTYPLWRRSLFPKWFSLFRPAVCLVVSGPGVLHTIGGLANATVNCWPVICIGGSSDKDQVCAPSYFLSFYRILINQDGRGGFQEWPQVESARTSCKFVAQISSLQSIPYLVQKVTTVSLLPPTVLSPLGNSFFSVW